MLSTIITSQSGKEITLTSAYTIVCNGVKKSSTAKQTISHRLDKQFSDLAKVIDKKPNGFVARMKQTR